MTSKPHSVQENIKAIEDALTYAERHLRPEFFSDRRVDARAALAGLVEQLQTAERERDAAEWAMGQHREMRERAEEQLEVLRNGCEQALLLLKRHRYMADPEAKVIRAVLISALDSNPASTYDGLAAPTKDDSKECHNESSPASEPKT